MNRTDTIIAPATPPGEGGLAVIRLSGPDAKKAACAFFEPSGRPADYESHHLYHGYLKDSGGRHVDEVMFVYMRAPRSYTCEDVVEIHCHGGRQTVRVILDLFLASGVRLAEPGEFTYRAFMHGRLDLAQAEAVARLIHARSETARLLALSQVEGRLSQAIHRFTDSLRILLSTVEAWIDFPEEDLPAQENSRIISQVSEISREIAVLLDSFQTGRAYLEGVSILLIGRPNAGKSSLLNAFLGEDRAIVTNIPGTTRDTLEEGVTIGGLPVRLIDTAGFRDTEDPVEMEGVKRARSKIASADLVLLVVDGSCPIHPEDRLAYDACRDVRSLLVITKADLVAVGDVSFPDLPRFEVSAKTGAGLMQLRMAISDCFASMPGEVADSVVLTEQRHYDALQRCRDSLGRSLTALEDCLSLEFLALELRQALEDLGSISGETTPEHILDNIFSNFCIGK